MGPKDGDQAPAILSFQVKIMASTVELAMHPQPITTHFCPACAFTESLAAGKDIVRSLLRPVEILPIILEALGNSLKDII